MHVAAIGKGITSVHSLALQVVYPGAHPQELPAPSVVALHSEKVEKLYVVQAAATAQVVPLKAHVER